MPKKPTFRLRFADDHNHNHTTEQIVYWAKEYMKTKDRKTGLLNCVLDEVALDAGKSIRAGNYTAENFSIIYKWKLGNFITRFKDKFDIGLLETKIPCALENVVQAIEAQRTEDALTELTKLRSVGVRVATAFLAMISPEEHTVLDVNALWSLSIKRNDYPAWLYSAYLCECHALRSKYNVPLRTLDRALWKFADVKRPKRKRRECSA